MIESVDFEKIFYLYIRSNPQYFSTIKPSYFDSEEIALLFSVDKIFYDKFHQTPSKEQLQLIAKQPKYIDKISSHMIDIVFDTTMKEIDPVWLKETAEAMILRKTLDSSLVDTLEYVKTTKVNPGNVKQIVNKVKSLINDRNNINFNTDFGSDFFDAETHVPKPNSKISTQHKWVDNAIGGYREKTLNVYMGQSGVGKSIFLANDAKNYVQAGYNVAVVTAEMGEIDYAHRIGSNMFNIKISEYEKLAATNVEFLKNKIKNIKAGIIPPGELFIKEYPTSAVTVPEIEAWALELEKVKGIKLKVLIVDYINILENRRNPNSDNIYMKIKQICEDLRAIAIRNDWVIISVTQTTGNSYDTTDLGMKDVSESKGLVHTCDVIYAIIQDEQMYLEGHYWLKIVKIRNGAGKHSKCMYNIDYNYLRLIETDTTI